ncbi:hypothetical protein [Metabacillus sp. Hm71]|uniref:hypothetical protein n=1 Tax=Metabacillus sp. Hm71 TaxID=3450743 RepID=UPI003F43B20A
MHQFTLKTAYLAMMYVARNEGIELDEKYYELEDDLNGIFEVTDMIDNIENIYKLIEK